MDDRAGDDDGHPAEHRATVDDAHPAEHRATVDDGDPAEDRVRADDEDPAEDRVRADDEDPAEDRARADDEGPAALAAAAPEPPRETTAGQGPSTHAVGIGPGPARYRSAIAERLLADADVVVGFETVLEYVEDVVTGDALGCGYRDQTETLSTFGARLAAGESGVAAFMGDPNVSGYQFLGRLERAVEGTVRVVPGVSSIQLAASRARVPLEHATFASLHQRGDVEAELDRLARDVGERHLLVLPRPYDLMPGDVAATLLDAGASGDLPAIVYEHLAHDGEERTAATLADLADHAGGDEPAAAAFSDLSVLVVRRAE